MAAYAQARLTSDRWLLGHFVLPIAQLDEFKARLPAVPAVPWSLSLIFSQAATAELEQVRSSWFSAPSSATPAHVTIAALEFPPLPLAAIASLCAELPPDVDAFFEFPFDTDLEPCLAVLQGARVAAKLRTGGITAAAFPTAAQLSQRLLALAAVRRSFKLTAGLHHPVPGVYPLTYRPDSPVAAMHGFLNVAILAALAYQQSVTAEAAVELLEQSSPAELHFDREGLSWRDRHLSLSDLATVRSRFLRSFGSCSIQEPIAELKTLNLIEESDP